MLATHLRPTLLAQRIDSRTQLHSLFLSDRVAVMQSQPGRITEVIDVPFARPRHIALFNTPEFRQLEAQVSALLYRSEAA